MPDSERHPAVLLRRRLFFRRNLRKGDPTRPRFSMFLRPALACVKPAGYSWDMGTETIGSAIQQASDKYRREQLPLDRIAADRAQSERRAQDIRQAEANRNARTRTQVPGTTGGTPAPAAPIDRRVPSKPSPWGAV